MLNHTVHLIMHSVWVWNYGCLLNLRSKKPVNGYWTADGPDLTIIVLSWYKEDSPRLFVHRCWKINDYFEITTTIDYEKYLKLTQFWNITKTDIDPQENYVFII